MKRIIILGILPIVISTVFFTTPQFAYAGWGWLVYHERSFKGKVIDAVTKEPLEGSVIIAQYNINMLGPTGSHITLTDIQEALTNKNGEFLIPPLTKIIHPLSVGYNTFFLIWKPGYKKEEITDAYFFTKEPGAVEDLTVQTEKGFEIRPVRLGIMELTTLKTKEERLMGMPSPVGDLDKKQKNLIKAINDERRNLGLNGQLIIREGK